MKKQLHRILPIITILCLLPGFAAGQVSSDGPFQITGFELNDSVIPPEPSPGFPSLTALVASEIATTTGPGVVTTSVGDFEVTSITTGASGVVNLLEFEGTDGVEGLFDEDAPFSDFGVSGNVFVTLVEATLFFEPGEYTIGFSSDDGATLTLEGVTFDAEFNEEGSLDNSDLTFNQPRFVGQTFGTFTVGPGGLETDLRLVTFESVGDAELELFIAEEALTAVDAANVSLITLPIPEPATGVLLLGMTATAGTSLRRR